MGPQGRLFNPAARRVPVRRVGDGGRALTAKAPGQNVCRIRSATRAASSSSAKCPLSSSSMRASLRSRRNAGAWNAEERASTPPGDQGLRLVRAQVRLPHRVQGHVVLVEGGQRHFEACSHVIDALRDADEEVTGEYRQPKCDLVVTAPLGFGQQHLQPVVHEFLRAYAQVNVHLQLADRVQPLVEDHVDCALRIGHLGDSSLVARTLGAIRIVVCAAPAYLEARGTPADLSALAVHGCISRTGLGPAKVWTLAGACERQVDLDHAPFDEYWRLGRIEPTAGQPKAGFGNDRFAGQEWPRVAGELRPGPGMVAVFPAVQGNPGAGVEQ